MYTLESDWRQSIINAYWKIQRLPVASQYPFPLHLIFLFWLKERKWALFAKKAFNLLCIAQHCLFVPILLFTFPTPIHFTDPVNRDLGYEEGKAAKKYQEMYYIQSICEIPLWLTFILAHCYSFTGVPWRCLPTSVFNLSAMISIRLVSFFQRFNLYKDDDVIPLLFQTLQCTSYSWFRFFDFVVLVLLLLF